MIIILILAGSYLLGSIPFGYIVAKYLKGIDIRKYGSGNIGATNIMRAIGTGPAILVFTADVFKGIIPVIITHRLMPDSAWMAVVSGLVAIVGHSLSVFLGFRGGKGVATSLGVIIGFSPVIALIGFASWIIIVAISRYVSLASIIAPIIICTLMLVFKMPVEYFIFSVIATSFIIIKHKSNISRLLQGNENKWGVKIKIDDMHGGKDGKGNSR